MSETKTNMNSSFTMWTGNLVGRIGKITFDNTNKGSRTIGLSVAHDVFVRNQETRETEKTTCWVDVIVFNGLAQRLGDYLIVGKAIVVSGDQRIRKGEYEHKITVIHPKTKDKLLVPIKVPYQKVEILANNIRLLPDGRGVKKEESTATATEVEVVGTASDEEIKQAASTGIEVVSTNKQTVPAAAQTATVDLDEDIPF